MREILLLTDQTRLENHHVQADSYGNGRVNHTYPVQIILLSYIFVFIKNIIVPVEIINISYRMEDIHKMKTYGNKPHGSYSKRQINMGIIDMFKYEHKRIGKNN